MSMDVKRRSLLKTLSLGLGATLLLLPFARRSLPVNQRVRTAGERRDRSDFNQSSQVVTIETIMEYGIGEGRPQRSSAA